MLCSSYLTHWGRVTHICVVNLTIIGSDNGLSPGWRQAIIQTNAGILLIGPLGASFSEILIGIQTFSFKKMLLKMSSAKWRPFCLCLNVLKKQSGTVTLTKIMCLYFNFVCWLIKFALVGLPVMNNKKNLAYTCAPAFRSGSYVIYWFMYFM